MTSPANTLTPLAYTAYLHEPEPGCWLVRFYDVPEAITQGDTREEALANASDALDAALEGYLEAERAWPTATDVLDHALQPEYQLAEVAVSPALAARALLARVMAERGVSKVALAKLMSRDEKIARRILAGASSLDLTLEALRALGVRPALAA